MELTVRSSECKLFAIAMVNTLKIRLSLMHIISKLLQLRIIIEILMLPLHYQNLILQKYINLLEIQMFLLPKKVDNI